MQIGFCRCVGKREDEEWKQKDPPRKCGGTGWAGRRPTFGVWTIELVLAAGTVGRAVTLLHVADPGTVTAGDHIVAAAHGVRVDAYWRVCEARGRCRLCLLH